MNESCFILISEMRFFVLLKELRGNFSYMQNIMYEAESSCRINGTGTERERQGLGSDSGGILME